MAKGLQLKASFLAMPPPLRILVLQQLSNFKSRQQHRYMSFIPPPSNDPDPVVHRAPDPEPSSLSAAQAFFARRVKNRSPFLFSAGLFRHLPLNTRVPEICLIGRSNVGKSTLLNALAGLSPAQAGYSNFSVNKKRWDLAVTGVHAGLTRTINAFGFGPPPPPGRQNDDRPRRAPSADLPDELWKRKIARKIERKELLSYMTQGKVQQQEQWWTNSLLLVDTPGYGFNSDTSWGVEIAKYLARRNALHGAIFLVDAVAGLKKNDRQVLELLRDTNVPTAVVLTKADKAAYNDEGLKKTCLDVWAELRRIDTYSRDWIEGVGWMKEIYVTGAGNPDRKEADEGVAALRVAVCRMAQLKERDGRFNLVMPDKAQSLMSEDEELLHLARGESLNQAGELLDKWLPRIYSEFETPPQDSQERRFTKASRPSPAPRASAAYSSEDQASRSIGPFQWQRAPSSDTLTLESQFLDDLQSDSPLKATRGPTPKRELTTHQRWMKRDQEKRRALQAL